LVFFNDPPPTEIYTLSLHDALPIYLGPDLRRDVLGILDVLVVHERNESILLDAGVGGEQQADLDRAALERSDGLRPPHVQRLERSEEHTSELQSLAYLVCRLLLEKK